MLPTWFLSQIIKKTNSSMNHLNYNPKTNDVHWIWLYYMNRFYILFCLILMEFPAWPGARALPVLYSLSQLFDLYKWDQISFWNEIYTYIIRSPWSNIGFQVLGFTTWQQFSKYVHSSIHYSKPFLFLHVSGCRAHKTEDCLRLWRC